MNCPYCNKQMLHGSIDVYDTLSWIPDGEFRKGSTKYTTSNNGILLAKYYLLSPASCEAYYCPHCSKIIINT